MVALELIGLTLLAGLAMPAGAVLARFEGLRPHWLENELRHSVIAFGGGALLSAVALVLVPEGSEPLSTLSMSVYFALGGVVFMGLDIALSKLKGSASQLVAMLADFIPESLALGAAYAAGGSTALLLALMIGLQNLPEGFNAYRELKQSSALSDKQVISAFTLMAFLGPLCGILGSLYLSAQPQALGAIMVFAAGGIMYVVFQDIAPQAKLANRYGPAVGAVAGFLLGMIGQAVTGG